MSNKSNQILKNTNAQILDEFNASIMFDKELYAQDIKGSIAHSQMLCEQGILTKEEQEAIEKGLLQVKDEIESGEFKFSLAFEDIHMAVESRLTEIVGEPGKNSILQEVEMIRLPLILDSMFKKNFKYKRAVKRVDFYFCYGGK